MIAKDESLSFREMVKGDRFWFGAEANTTAGIGAPDSADQLVQLVQAVLNDPRIGCICITDRAQGTRILAPDYLSGMLSGKGSRIVLTLTCRDANRNGLAAMAWSRSVVQGFNNVLAVTGEYPVPQITDTTYPVFDLDSLALITQLHAINQGRTVPDWWDGPRTDLFIGCVVSPFKRHERELLPQYFKLLRKIAAGAHWVIPQPGYDMRKFNEVKLFLAHSGLIVPVIGHAYVLTREVARLFNRDKRAGPVVSDELLELANRYGGGADKGRSFFRELAARQLAVFKGLGFAGGFLAGVSKAETFGQIIDLAESFGPDDWRDFVTQIQFAQPDEYFFFEHDPKTGLSDPTRVKPAYAMSLEAPPRTRRVTLGYRLARHVHDGVFRPEKSWFKMLRRIYARWDTRPGIWARLAYRLERRVKSIAYGCEACGDCCLDQCAYLCPMASCPKHSRNGPCGDSTDGKCAVTGTECLWARAYDRMKYSHRIQQMLERPVLFYNAELHGTSSWANAFVRHGRLSSVDNEKNPDEHHAKGPI